MGFTFTGLFHFTCESSDAYQLEFAASDANNTLDTQYKYASFFYRPKLQMPNVPDHSFCISNSRLFFPTINKHIHVT